MNIANKKCCLKLTSRHEGAACTQGSRTGIDGIGPRSSQPDPPETLLKSTIDTQGTDRAERCSYGEAEQAGSYRKEQPPSDRPFLWNDGTWHIRRQTDDRFEWQKLA